MNDRIQSWYRVAPCTFARIKAVCLAVLATTLKLEAPELKLGALLFERKLLMRFYVDHFLTKRQIYDSVQSKNRGTRNF